MDNVRPIRNTAPTPDPEVVALLREMLARAERGELQAVAGVFELANGASDDFFEGSATWLTLVGRLHYLAHFIAKGEVDGVDDDEE